MKREEKKLILYEVGIILFSLLIGLLVPVLKEYKMIIALMIEIIVFKVLFGLDKKKKKDTKETIIAITVFLITFFIVYYLFGFMIGFTIAGTLNPTLIITTILYVLGRENLRYNVLSKTKNKRLLLLGILLFIILDVLTKLDILQGNTDYHPLIIYCTVLFPILSNNIVLSYLSKKSGYIPTMFFAGITSVYRYIFPILPNTTLSATTTIDTLVPILLWVRMNSYYEKKERKEDTTNDNLINLSILVFPVVLMMIVLYFTSGYFRYESIAVGTNNLSPTIKRGDVIIIDKRENHTIKEGDIVAYKRGNNMRISKIEKREFQNNHYYYYIEKNIKISEEKIVGKVIIRIKYIGWPAIWYIEKD